MNIKYKFICTINGDDREVFPVGFSETSLVEEPFGENIFYRKAFNGKLFFNNVGGIGDYDYFYGIESGVDQCEEISILIQRSCDGGATYTDYWNGYFSVIDGDFDRDKCLYSVKPNIDDEYRCFIENKDKEFNLSTFIDKFSTTAIIIPSYEFYTCRDIPGNCTGSLPGPPGTYLQFHSEQIDGEWTTIYYREVAITACEGGIAVEPSGGGWEQDLSYGDCDNGLAKFVRAPLAGAISNLNPDVAPGNCDLDFEESIPPMEKTFDVAITATPSTQDIEGYEEAFEYDSGFPFEPEYYYSVPNNPNSTYVWSIVGGTGTASIVGGGTTNECRVRFTDGGCTPALTVILRCTETHGNAHVSTKDITIDTYGAACFVSLEPQLELEVIGPTTVCKNQEGIIYRIPKRPTYFDAPVWSVTGDATIASGQGTDQITVDAGDDNFIVNCEFSYDISSPVLRPGHEGDLNVTVTNAARTPEITGIDSVYDNETDIPYQVQTRAGATYEWLVDGGVVASGQGTGTITVDWGSGSSGVVIVKEIINCGCNWILITNCDDALPSFYWCPSEGITTNTYDKNNFLLDVFNSIADQICSAHEDTVSDFFEYNPPGDTPGYVAGINYVTGEPNKVTALSIMKKVDFVDPDSDQSASKGVLTFDRMTEWLRNIFKVYWFIENGNIRLEHISYFQRAVAYDLTVDPYRKSSKGTNKYSYERDKMPKYERFKWQEAASTDFVGSEIRYDSICVLQDSDQNVSQTNINDVTTDIVFAQNSPDDISKDGFIIMANDISETPYVVLQEAGLISGLILSNAHLSWANLHYNYHRYERVLSQGFMNLILTNFITVKRTKKQVPVIMPLCCDTINPLIDLITTDVGNGVVERITYNHKTNGVQLELMFQ